MSRTELHPKAWVALALGGLFSATQALCAIFVSVYLWRNTHDFSVVCRHYLALYAVTPFVFIAAGWFAQARDRLHAYQLGLVLHVVFYAALLMLKERAADYPIELGVLLALAWGVFYAAANTFQFDVSLQGRREYYLGLFQSISGVFQLLAPLAGGFIISYAPTPDRGYFRVFALVLALTVVGFFLSFLMPRDSVRRPFRIKRALFPGPDQRDWRLLMLAATTLAGSFSIFGFLLGLLMYMATENEATVGGYASFQALAGVLTSFVVGRLVTPRTRRGYLKWGVILLVAAGGLMAFKLTIFTLVLFGFLRAVAQPMFGIPHIGLRLDVILHTAKDPAQRIEYLAAWEIPLAASRVVTMTTMMGLYGFLQGNEIALRVAVFLLCAIRIVTYLIMTRISALREEG